MSLELRKASDGTATISGEASVGDAEYSMGSHFERVSAGAFTRTLRQNPDVLLTPEHDRSRAVARTGDGGNLELRESTSGGLYYLATVDTANDADARSLTSKIDRRVYRESSFAFRVPKGGDQWNSDFTLRTINRVDLHRGEVSVVPFGASPTTSATVQRAAIGTLHERRAMAERISSTGWFGPGLVMAERQGWLINTRAYARRATERATALTVMAPGGTATMRAPAAPSRGETAPLSALRSSCPPAVSRSSSSSWPC